MSRYSCLPLVGAVLAAFGCAGPESRALSAAREIQAPPVIRDLPKLRASSARLAEELDRSDSRLHSFSDETVARLCDATARVTFHFPDDSRAVALQRRLLDEKLSRRIQTERDVRDMYLAYVGARSFGAAAEFRRKFPEAQLPFVPEILPPVAQASGGLWQAYDVFEEGAKAKLVDLPIGTGPRIVVSMLTSCGVTERAVKDILGTPEFAEKFRAEGYLVTMRFDSQGVANWRRHFDFGKVYLGSNAGSFPGLDFRSSPHFFFLRDGKVVYHFEGWGQGEGYDTSAQFREGLKALAL